MGDSEATRPGTTAGEFSVWPILLDGTVMPQLDQLPPSLRPLTRCHAVQLRLTELEAGVGALIEGIAARESSPSIFINYRHEDAGPWAHLLYDRMAARFGSESVFLDVRTLAGGQRWLDTIRARSSAAIVFLALIGPRWATLLAERAGTPPDYVRDEIEAALRSSGADRPLTTNDRTQSVAPTRQGQAPQPDPDHYDEVVQVLLHSSLSVFLGLGANSSDRNEPWHAESSYLPDAKELAAYLASKIGLDDDSDLAKVSQQVWEMRQGELYPALRRTLAAPAAPGSVHRFLASLPGTLDRLGCSGGYPLIVTTNYDDALERAFGELDVPYDLAVYIAAQGHPDNGRFVHVPHGGEPIVVSPANTYTGFPFNRFDSTQLERTVIVKIHGSVDTASLRDNYVIKEDDYIDYLSRSATDQVVPLQIGDKLQNSQLLFLGYTVREWNLRVFLQRMFGQHVPNGSWAVERDATRLDARFWRNTSAELFAVPLPQYVRELSNRLAALAASAA